MTASFCSCLQFLWMLFGQPLLQAVSPFLSLQEPFLAFGLPNWLPFHYSMNLRMAIFGSFSVVALLSKEKFQSIINWVVQGIQKLISKWPMGHANFFSPYMIHLPAKANSFLESKNLCFSHLLIYVRKSVSFYCKLFLTFLGNSKKQNHSLNRWLSKNCLISNLI